MRQKIWTQSSDIDKDIIKDLAAQSNISETVATILFVRGIDTAEKIKAYLSTQPAYNDPKLLKDAVRAAKRILCAVEQNECIAIYGDYDVDGICSTSLLYRFLTDYLGAQNVKYFIPSRVKEGYGLNATKLLEMAQDGVNLLISVDCGISNYDIVETVNSLMDVIITDHHQIPEKLPNAYAVVNPQQSDCDYPFKSLAGVGVTFKLCQAIWQIYKNDESLYFDDFLELVALATVADIVPLVDENRSIVKFGLEKMQDSSILGIRELARVSGYTGQRIMATSLGFNMAPRLNAVGRLSDANIAVRMLVSKQEDEAKKIAELLDAENIERQNVELGIMQEAEDMLKQEGLPGCIILANNTWNAGVIGIVASKLVDKYYLPTVLLSIDEDGIAKGSCRSIKALDLYKALQSLQHLLLNFGGHHQAAGLSLHKDNIPQFKKEFVKYITQNLSEQDYQPVIHIDCEIENFASLDESLLAEMEQLEPCGFGNHKPRLSARKVAIERINTFSEGKHLRLFLQKDCSKKLATLWKGGELSNVLKAGSSVDIAFNIAVDNWQSINLNVLDIHHLKDFVDYRYGNYSLENFLQANANHDNIAIYSMDQPPSGVLALAYQDPIPPNIDTLVVHSVPSKTELEILKTVVDNSGKVLRIVFLFKKQHVCDQEQRLATKMIDREKLKKFFLLLKQQLETVAKLDITQLHSQSWFGDFSDCYIQILQELELLTSENDNLQLIQTANKKDLNDSQILRGLCSVHNIENKHLNNLKTKSMSELF